MILTTLMDTQRSDAKFIRCNTLMVDVLVDVQNRGLVGPGSKDPDLGFKDPSWRGSGRGLQNRVFWPMSSLSKAF